MISHFYTHPSPKKIRYRKKDPQRHTVYRMEREIIGNAVDTFVPLDKLQGIADHACRKAGVKRIVINAYASAEKVFGYVQGGELYLNKTYHGHNTSVLLHELAHHITDEQNGGECEDHGPTFLWTYRELLDSYKILPTVCFDALTKKHGLIVHAYCGV